MQYINQVIATIQHRPERGMGIAERRERERAMRQRLIQDAATELFMKKGFFSVKMEDIAEKAELSIATIYLYFKSKDELYASLNAISLQYLHDEVKKVYTDQSRSVDEKMMGYKDALKNTYHFNPTMLQVIFHLQLYDILTSLDKKLLNQLNSLGRRTMNMIADTYEEGVRQGKFEDGNGIAHADIIWALFTGLVLWEGAKKLVSPKKDFFDTTLDRAFAIFCRGIRAIEPDRRRLEPIDAEGAVQERVGDPLVADG
jgi:AcrR family transcriptional regulator